MKVPNRLHECNECKDMEITPPAAESPEVSQLMVENKDNHDQASMLSLPVEASPSSVKASSLLSLMDQPELSTPVAKSKTDDIIAAMQQRDLERKQAKATAAKQALATSSCNEKGTAALSPEKPAAAAAKIQKAASSKVKVMKKPSAATATAKPSISHEGYEWTSSGLAAANLKEIKYCHEQQSVQK